MDTSNLFTVALNLGKPWSVSKVDFIPATDNPTQMELHIWVSYPDSTKFSIRLLSMRNYQELDVKIMVSAL